MSTEESVAVCYRKWRDYSGRASQSEFWQFYLLVFVAERIVWTIHNWLHENFGFRALIVIFVIAMYPPLVAAAARRMHDVGLPFWPLIAAAVILAITYLSDLLATVSTQGKLALITSIFALSVIALAFPSQKKTNKYGPNLHEVTS
jgi:uncharacterized membrane protein YhaH (DUF805 family)